MDGYANDGSAAGPARHVPARGGYQRQARTDCPAAAMSSNVGGMGAHWTGACPRPGRQRTHRLPRPTCDELLTEAERLLGVDAHAFDDAPFAAEVRKRLSGALDDGRRRGPEGCSRCRWP